MKNLFFSVILLALTYAGAAQSSLHTDEVLGLAGKVADWQLANPGEKAQNTWEYGTFYSGLIDLYQVTREKKYLDAIVKMGEEINWELRPRPYDANVYAIGHALFELYEITGEKYMIDKLRHTMDMPLMRWLEPEVVFDGNKYWWEWWTWCDALFMAPPTYARGAKLLNRPEYLDYMVKMWKLTSDYLYSPEDSLYFRDDRFFKKREDTGVKIFWSRGNGWVIGGLCKVLEYLPEDHPERPFFEHQFVEMMTRVKDLQLESGGWPTSLLRTDDNKVIETSGTAFFCYGMAWGINHHLLSEKEFLPSVSSAWKLLESCVEEDGKLGYVQQVGDQPDEVSREDTEAYGTGALLMAGSELYKLLK